ncbi:MAG TPA: hypothetical protein VN577_04800 [Terriglobales bacterium]|nr:hypothetical protein [Terriglobales bacterium]
MATETVTATSGGFVGGTELYHERARQILPILVRQARAAQPIYYSELAREIGVSNARTLNYPLGAIGGELRNLSTKWNLEIPKLQSLVINKSTNMPGEGFDLFLKNPDAYRRCNPAQRRKILDMMLTEVYTFPDWDRVLTEFGLPPAKAALAKLPSPLSARVRSHTGAYGTGEGEEHRRLKEYVAANPETVGLGAHFHVLVEHEFASADIIDVLFKSRTQWVGIEVKGVRSDETDIARGMFQCVKYQALIEAEQKTLLLPVNAKVLLVLGGQLPSSLIALQNVLGIEIVTGVTAPLACGAATS